MGNTKSNQPQVISGMKRLQEDVDVQRLYKLVDMHGGGELLPWMKYTKQTGDHTVLDGLLETKVSSFILYFRILCYLFFQNIMPHKIDTVAPFSQVCGYEIKQSSRNPQIQNRQPRPAFKKCQKVLQISVIVKIWPSLKMKRGIWSRNENHDK
jgi:hypothetical protein